VTGKVKSWKGFLKGVPSRKGEVLLTGRKKTTGKKESALYSSGEIRAQKRAKKKN